MQNLQHELDTSESVQRDFVKLSQELQMKLEKIRQAEEVRTRGVCVHDWPHCRRCAGSSTRTCTPAISVGVCLPNVARERLSCIVDTVAVSFAMNVSRIRSSRARTRGRRACAHSVTLCYAGES
jgi:hypothetical protein